MKYSNRSFFILLGILILTNKGNSSFFINHFSQVGCRFEHPYESVCVLRFTRYCPVPTFTKLRGIVNQSSRSVINAEKLQRGDSHSNRFKNAVHILPGRKGIRYKNVRLSFKNFYLNGGRSIATQAINSFYKILD